MALPFPNAADIATDSADHTCMEDANDRYVAELEAENSRLNKTIEEMAVALGKEKDQVSRLTQERDEDAKRWTWLQGKYGNTPWKLVHMIPGTKDVRVAIDQAIKWEATQSTPVAEPQEER